MSRFEKSIWALLFVFLAGWALWEGYKVYDTILQVRKAREEIRRLDAQICDVESKFVRSTAEARDMGMNFNYAMSTTTNEDFKLLVLWVFTNNSINPDDLATEHTRKCLKKSKLDRTVPKRPLT